MPVTGNREQCLALGVNLGWAQQGAAFGGRPARMLAEDLERVRSHAGAAGYRNFDGMVAAAMSEIRANQNLNAATRINALINFLQAQH